MLHWWSRGPDGSGYALNLRPLLTRSPAGLQSADGQHRRSDSHVCPEDRSSPGYKTRFARLELQHNGFVGFRPSNVRVSSSDDF